MRQYIQILFLGIFLFSSWIWAGTAQVVDANEQIIGSEDKTESLSFYINYVYRSGGAGELKSITNGSVLSSGDHYKIIFIPDKACYVYIFQIDSSGQIFRLFPMKQFQGIRLQNTNPAQHGKTYIIPSADKAFVLDKRLGTERIYFIASKERHREIEAFYGSIKSADKRHSASEIADNQNRLKKYFKKRGMVAVTPSDKTLELSWKKDDDVLAVIGQRLENLGKGNIHLLEFQHH